MNQIWKQFESLYIREYTLQKGSEKICSHKSKSKLKLLLSANGPMKEECTRSEMAASAEAPMCVH